jgi:hypothetical protein
LDGFGQVQVREIGDVLGHDRVDRAGCGALLVEGDAQALAKAGNHDLFQRFLRRRVLRQRCRDGRKRHHAKDCLHRQAKAAIAI